MKELLKFIQMVISQGFIISKFGYSIKPELGIGKFVYEIDFKHDLLGELSSIGSVAYNTDFNLVSEVMSIMKEQEKEANRLYLEKINKK